MKRINKKDFKQIFLMEGWINVCGDQELHTYVKINGIKIGLIDSEVDLGRSDWAAELKKGEVKKIIKKIIERNIPITTGYKKGYIPRELEDIWDIIQEFKIKGIN